MTTYQRPTSYAALKGKTVLLTGCATGIGRQTAILAYGIYPMSKFQFGNLQADIHHTENGANLALADWNEKDALSLVSELRSSPKSVHLS